LIGFNAFIPFLLVHDYLFDDQNLFRILYMFARVSRYFLLYISGKSYGSIIFKMVSGEGPKEDIDYFYIKTELLPLSLLNHLQSTFI